MIASRQLCTFYLDGHLFGVDARTVQEVIRYQEMTRVPKAPPSVSGLINLRGQIVTAIDLRTRLGLKPREEGRLPMNVVDYEVRVLQVAVATIFGFLFST
ncbi:MAG: chemotaxis protein CheW [Pirellulaceae bacterium]|nr:chemotaxis protein CheW [Pirellulaceae bacterium]